jgi:hypothetical protein
MKSILTIFLVTLFVPALSLCAQTPVSGPTVEIGIEASDEGTGVSIVRVFIDGVLIRTFTEQTPVPEGVYSATWDTTGLADGPHVIRAEAEDGAGNVSSVERDVTVDNNPPSVILTITVT